MPSGSPFQIVVAEPFDAEAIDRLSKVGKVEVLDDSAPDTIMAAVPDADALLVRSKAHITARIIAAAPRLKVIGRASPTVDHIDLHAASKNNISVVYAPHAAVNSSAEFTLGLMMALHCRIPWLNKQLRSGQFESLRKPSRQDLSTLTIGFLGFDAVADRLGVMLGVAFGSRLIYHEPSGAGPTAFEAESVELDRLLAEADVLTIHLSLTRETRGILGKDALARMKPSAIVVNTGRGGVIDTVALATALRDRVIAGAALDVFETEPLPANHVLRRAPNCILTPHVSGMTLDASAGRFRVADDVIRVLSGEEPLYPVQMPQR